MGRPAASDDPRPLTKAAKAKIAAWRRQHAALEAPGYRITLMSRADGLPTYVLGKGRGSNGTELFYSANEVEALIPYLSRENMIGRDIYVTPMDRSRHFVVVDDMTAESAAALEAEGHRPALVQESSPGNLQAVLITPRERGRDEQKAANLVVVGLNRRHGDPAFSGVVHPFRMAGFANKKPGKGSPFTRILRAVGGICERTSQMIASARARLGAPEKAGGALSAPERARRPSHVLPAPSAAADARWDALRAEGLRVVELRGWELDESRMDYRIATGLRREGFSREEIAGAMERRSPGLATRHRDVSTYIARTLDAAGRPSGRPEPRVDEEGPEGP